MIEAHILNIVEVRHGGSEHIMIALMSDCETKGPYSLDKCWQKFGTGIASMETMLAVVVIMSAQSGGC